MNFHVLITHILIHYTSAHVRFVLSIVFSPCFTRPTQPMCPLNSGVVSELWWYVVWRWFYVHTIDYAKQFMFCVWIGDNDANWFVCQCFAHLFIYSSHIWRGIHSYCFWFFLHSPTKWLFISNHQHKNDERNRHIPGGECMQQWNIKINITTVFFYILLSGLMWICVYFFQCSRHFCCDGIRNDCAREAKCH